MRKLNLFTITQEMRQLPELINAIQANFENLKKHIADNDLDNNRRFISLTQRNAGTEGRMRGIEARVNSLETRMLGIEERLTAIEYRLTALESWIQDMNGNMNNRFDTLFEHLKINS